MNKYTEIVVKAINTIREGRVQNPVEAWEVTVTDVFGNNITSYNRNCARNTFLGLCEEGYIKGINRGKYTLSRINKEYVVNLREKIFKSQTSDEDKLWLAINMNDKKHFLHLQIVKELYEEKILV